MIKLQGCLLLCMSLTCSWMPAACVERHNHSDANTTAKTTPELLTICVFIEDDSYYTTAQRLAAAVDLAVSHANEYVLQNSLIKIQAQFQSTGPSCSKTDFSASSNAYKLLQSGVTCNAFLGAGCATTAADLYGLADSLNVIFMGTPAAGLNALSLDNSHDYFPLVVKVAFDFGDLAEFTNVFLDRYHYDHMVLVRDTSHSFFSLLSKMVLEAMRKDVDKLAAGCSEIIISADTDKRKDYRKVLEDAHERARVIALLAPAQAVREMMIVAHEVGFTQGDLVFLAVELYELKYWGKIHYSQGDNDDEVAKTAFRNLLIFSLHQSGKDSVYADDFEDKLKKLSHRRYHYTFNSFEKLDPVITSSYEAIQMYAQEVVIMEAEDLDYRNGSLISSRTRKNTYFTDLGKMSIGADGQRDMDYDVKVFNQDSGKFDVAVTYFQHPVNGSKAFRIVQDFNWPNQKPGKLPEDEPHCGYLHDKCRDDSLSPGIVATAVTIPLFLVFAVAAIGAAAFTKFRKLNAEYNPNWWKINSDDVTVKQHRSGSIFISKKTLTSRSTVGTVTSGVSGYSAHLCNILGSYKGDLVLLNDVTSQKKHVLPDLVAEIALLKGMNHPNLQSFIGITINPRGLCEFIVTDVCSKGSLTDILHNDVFKLDWSFKNSLIQDIVFGMTEIHASAIVSHGHLNSHFCLIDSRFTLKISDYGLAFFGNLMELLPPKWDHQEQRDFEALLWRAPELLRQVMPPKGTQRGDAYSFAIILQQIILRSGPFQLPNEPWELSDQEILQEIINSNIPPVRPRVPRAACSNELYDLMESCWEEIALERPTFPKIKERLKIVIGNVGNNIVDVLLRRMEQYATDLEQKVAEKTEQFMDEKNRSEQLLSQLLPKSIAAALMRGEHIDPEAYEGVTIFFSDIVGFTTISAAGSPMDVISLLNNLYTFFDGILEKHDVYKVETIGDAYMVASGLPVRNGNNHVSEICRMSLTLVDGIVAFFVPGRPTDQLEVRIGINSGPCVAGIVGIKMPRYCLFGDTVNLASRMESTGEPMKIQISLSTKALLDNIGGFHAIERGPVTVKGKGLLTTYWLLSA